ncbi:MAG TPA: hypothetical protein DHW82_00370 [Spirochaetia bacterium]|nr:MAG: hypothetical protein A2Y41_07265 [Spirochaetes bacterium GWB1_36_13]HCL55453.1 hypothetical protein [Spirochaetia bacterium]
MAFFEKTKDEVLAEVFSEASEKLGITEFVEGGDLRNILEITAEYKYRFYQLLNQVFENAFIMTASGSWLDLKCAEIGIYRTEAVKTKGTVFFYRNTADSSNIVIPAGTMVKTKIDVYGKEYRYLTTAEAVLEADITEIEAEIESELEGVSYNVGIDRITELQTPIDGIDGVENRIGWISQYGADSETDESLKNRFLLKWGSLAGANETAYLNWISGISGIDQKIIIPLNRGFGTVDIFITSTAGSPSQELLDEVQAVVDENKPLGISVQVKAPDEEPFNINADIVIYPGYHTGTVIDSVIEKLSNYANALKIGEDVIRNRIITQAGTVDGVKDIVLNEPVSNITVAKMKIGKIGTITVNGTQAGEI